MGSFYTNVALRTDDIDTVSSVLEEMRRTAYVGTDGKTVLVFDEKCDEQDIDEIQRLAEQLSKRMDCVALAVVNHDDDVFWYALVTNGTVTDTYDSFPGYFDSGSEEPKGGDASKLCAAFDVSRESEAVAALLRRPHREFMFEVNRHEALCDHLGLPAALSTLGFRYVYQGELDDHPLAATIRAIGDVEGDERPPQPTVSWEAHARTQSEIAPEAMAAMQREAQNLMWETYALTLNEAEVPERFVPLFGVRRGHGHVLAARLTEYIRRNNLNVGGGWVRADDLLAEFLGEREFIFVAVTRLVRQALGIPPLSPEQREELQRSGPLLFQRIIEAAAAAQEQARKDQP